MKLKVAWIGKTKEQAITSLTEEYLKRLSRYADVTSAALRDEAALQKWSGHGASSGTRNYLVLLDSRGKQLSSEDLAKFIANHQQRNPLPLCFAVGPADGFAEQTREQADMLLSLGNMTLPHELARVVLLEQLYRAFTILAGHPYHGGH